MLALSVFIRFHPIASVFFRLHPFSSNFIRNQDEIADLLQRKFGRPFPDKAVHFIHEHSDGTPLWVNQLADVVGAHSDKTGDELEALLSHLPDSSNQLEQSVMTQFDRLTKQQQEILKFGMSITKNIIFHEF
jgi:hypothetical protein